MIKLLANASDELIIQLDKQIGCKHKYIELRDYANVFKSSGIKDDDVSVYLTRQNINEYEFLLIRELIHIDLNNLEALYAFKMKIKALNQQVRRLYKVLDGKQHKKKWYKL